MNESRASVRVNAPLVGMQDAHRSLGRAEQIQSESARRAALAKLERHAEAMLAIVREEVTRGEG